MSSSCRSTSKTTFALRLVADGAGGVGYLLKDRVEDLDDFADAIRRIAHGGSVIDPEVVAQLVGRRRASVPLDDLTVREREVLALMAEGGSNQGHLRAPVLGAKDCRGPHRQHLLQARAGASARRPPPRPRGPGTPSRLSAATRGIRVGPDNSYGASPMCGPRGGPTFRAGGS